MNKIYIGKDKWFDADCLKHFQKSNRIDWLNSVGCSVKFQCGDYNGFYTILNKKNSTENNKEFIYEICFNDNRQKTYFVKRHVLSQVNFLQFFGKYETNFIYKVGDVVNDKFLILKTERKHGMKNTKIYTYKCLVDGYIGESSEQALKIKKKCPVCAGYKIMLGINDIATTRPELCHFLVDKTDAFKYTASSGKFLKFKCDICGTSFKAQPCKFPSSFPCGCYSAQSYPNRFIRELFNMLNIPYISELTKRHFSWCENYRYDLYFELDGRKYIVEMDGGQHKEEKQVSIDKIKNFIALKNNVEVIRIDCDYTDAGKRFNYIKNNIINSKLSNIFDLSFIDWNSINIKILTRSIVKEVSDFKKQGYSNEEIAIELNIAKDTVVQYLQLARESGLITSKPYVDKSKVMQVINLADNKTFYYINLKSFYDNSFSYINFKMSDYIYQQNEKDGHVLLNGYDISKITYKEYVQKTAVA